MQKILLHCTTGRSKSQVVFRARTKYIFRRSIKRVFMRVSVLFLSKKRKKERRAPSLTDTWSAAAYIRCILLDSGDQVGKLLRLGARGDVQRERMAVADPGREVHQLAVAAQGDNRAVDLGGRLVLVGVVVAADVLLARALARKNLGVSFTAVEDGDQLVLNRLNRALALGVQRLGKLKREAGELGGVVQRAAVNKRVRNLLGIGGFRLGLGIRGLRLRRGIGGFRFGRRIGGGRNVGGFGGLALILRAAGGQREQKQRGDQDCKKLFH